MKTIGHASLISGSRNVRTLTPVSRPRDRFWERRPICPRAGLRLTDRIGPASDVYSIGALLYALLTGQPPFRGRDTLETLSHVRERDPQLPRQLNPYAPRELELICLKCLEKKPADRYGGTTRWRTTWNTIC